MITNYFLLLPYFILYINIKKREYYNKFILISSRGKKIKNYSKIFLEIKFIEFGSCLSFSFL